MFGLMLIKKERYAKLLATQTQLAREAWFARKCLYAEQKKIRGLQAEIRVLNGEKAKPAQATGDDDAQMRFA